MTTISRRMRAAYAAGGFGKDMMFAMSTVMLYYFNNLLGISSAFLGIMMLAVRVWDAVNDPVMGTLVDRTRSRWGKFRPWILIGTVLNAGVTVVLFSNPDLVTNSIEQLVFVTTMYTLWGMTYTMMDIPYWSLIPALSEDQGEREQITVLARIFTGIGYFVIAGGYVTFADLLGRGDKIFGLMVLSVIVAVVFIGTELFTVRFVREQVVVPEQRSPGLSDMWRLLRDNDQLLVVMGVVLVINFTLYTTSGMAIYYITYNVGNEGLYIVFIGVGGILQLVGSGLYPLLSGRLSRRRIYDVAIAVQLVGFLLLFLNAFFLGSNVVLMFALGATVFLGQGVFLVLQTVLLSDTVEYGEYRTGRRSESVAFSVQTFVVKLAMGLSLGVIGVGLSVIGFAPPVADAAGVLQQQVQGEATLVGMSALMFVLPIAGLLLGRWLFVSRHRLDEATYAGIVEQLEARRAAAKQSTISGGDDA